MLRLLKKLWFQVLVAMAAGVLLGWLQPSLGQELQPLGDGFIALVRMIIAPVIFCTVVHGVAGMSDMRRVGRVALKALVYFEAVTTLALVLALTVVNLWRPGVGMNHAVAGADAQQVAGYVAQALRWLPRQMWTPVVTPLALARDSTALSEAMTCPTTASVSLRSSPMGVKPPIT